MAEAENAADAPRRGRARGPHPLPMFLALLSRRLGDQPDRLRAALGGLRRYQEAPSLPAQPPLQAVARRGGVRLLRVGGPADAGGGAADAGGGPPLVLVPSLINAPVVLDLAPGRSLVRYLAAQGHETFLLDWGRMGPSERRLGLAGLVSARLLPLVEGLGPRVQLAGYCLGGTLALAAGQLLRERLDRLALIATPWHFAGFPEAARREALAVWRAAKLLGAELGAVPVTLLNPLFWALDEEAVVSKFEALQRRPPGDPGIAWFAAVEDWASSGSPLPLPAARDLFVHGFANDRIGRGLWQVRGEQIRPQRIAAPILDFGALNDRIVPPEARLGGDAVLRRDVHSGHVGMVVGSAARETLWEPLSNWLHGR